MNELSQGEGPGTRDCAEEFLCIRYRKKRGGKESKRLGESLEKK